MKNRQHAKLKQTRRVVMIIEKRYIPKLLESRRDDTFHPFGVLDTMMHFGYNHASLSGFF